MFDQSGATNGTVWDVSFDFVSVGSGGGGLVAALKAEDEGLDTLVIEKQSLVGGSTAMSGGMVWMPNNPLMRANGTDDSYQDALAYFDSVVGDGGPGSSPARRHAFVTEGPRIVGFLQRHGVKFVPAPGWADNYDTYQGGKTEGRSIECPPFDAGRLGEWEHKIQPGITAGIGFVAGTYELLSLMNFNRSVPAFVRTARIFLRTKLARVRKKTLLGGGAALIGNLLEATLDRDVPIWTDTAVVDLVTEGDRVVGVRATRAGKDVYIQARKGVLLAAGGFAHNRQMREMYGGDQIPPGEWTIANRGDTGEVLAAAMRLGAQTDLMDEAWWLPRTMGGGGISTLDNARCRPRTIMVDASGQRFVNEANSKVQVGKAMFARDKTARAIPSWLITDDRYRRRYNHTHSLRHLGRFPKEWLATGYVKSAPTLEDLARSCGIDPHGLEATVQRFNAHARQGIDPDFHRGESEYNRLNGDPANKPNPTLGPIEDAPFYAIELIPADVGTCGGLVTDEHAQVLGTDNEPITGLYATGNTTATIMGRTYMSAGGSISNSIVFGYLAAAHAAQCTSETDARHTSSGDSARDSIGDGPRRL
ncbi:FAD-binding protein [Rhodococcus aetherivorans]